MLVLCSSYSIRCEMPILILNVTTGVTFKYKYHKLATLTSQSREYSWFRLQITEESTAPYSQSASHSPQNILFTNDRWQQEMQSIWDVLCAGSQAVSTSHPGRPHPLVISSHPWSPHSRDEGRPSDLISSACCNNWHWRTLIHSLLVIHNRDSNKTPAAFQSITISSSLHPS